MVVESKLKVKSGFMNSLKIRIMETTDHVCFQIKDVTSVIKLNDMKSIHAWLGERIKESEGKDGGKINCT